MNDVPRQVSELYFLNRSNLLRVTDLFACIFEVCLAGFLCGCDLACHFASRQLVVSSIGTRDGAKSAGAGVLGDMGIPVNLSEAFPHCRVSDTFSSAPSLNDAHTPNSDR